jgi:uncharacterized membrane protein YqaE (UPF0057 family)
MKKTATRLTIAALSLSLFAAPAQAAFVSTPATAVEATTTTTTNSEAVLKNAVKESWTSLSRSERKSRINAAKDAIKNMKDASTNKVLLVILAILLPWAAVWVHQGTFNTKVLIALILWLLFYIPGLIYALLVIFGNA